MITMYYKVTRFQNEVSLVLHPEGKGSICLFLLSVLVPRLTSGRRKM